MSPRNLVIFCSQLLCCGLLSFPAYSQQDNSSSQNQDSRAQNQSTVEGTVISAGRNTFVVRSDDNRFHLFTFDGDTKKPRSLSVGSQVQVKSDEGDQPDARHATEVTVEQQAQGGTAGGSSVRSAAPVPPSVRNVENQIEHEARRWRLGARAGVGLDPELVLFGIHSQMGPVFSRNIFFRPNADFEWGEITDLVALNLEAVYRIPHARRGQWSPYLGAGPSLNFIHQSFKTSASQQRNISFGNFDYETGFNLLLGFQNRHGTFFEAKTSLYSQPAPIFRLIIGHNF